MTFLLKKNSEDIRNAIREEGIDVCVCSGFNGAVWLDFTPGCTDSVHGIGYPFEGMTSEETISFTVHEWKQNNVEIIECKDVHEFIQKIKEYLNGKQ